MNYGFYTSAAGALTSAHRQNVLANNLANVGTVGFKADSVVTLQRDPERIEGGHGFIEPNWLLEKLGGPMFSAPTRIDLKQGDLVQSTNPLDVALQGEGFFVVSSDGATDDASLRLTRDGRFTLNAAGELVSASNGMTVLDASNRTITLDRSAPVTIDNAGAVIQNGEQVARLRLANVSDASQLVKTGENAMKLADGGSLVDAPDATRTQQGYTEASAVDPITTMVALMSAAKAVNANLNMMKYHDNALARRSTRSAGSPD
jgi:flagellar basal-body rod protein FlgF